MSRLKLLGDSALAVVGEFALVVGAVSAVVAIILWKGFYPVGLIVLLVTVIAAMLSVVVKAKAEASRAKAELEDTPASELRRKRNIAQGFLDEGKELGKSAGEATSDQELEADWIEQYRSWRQRVREWLARDFDNTVVADFDRGRGDMDFGKKPELVKELRRKLGALRDLLEYALKA